VSKKFYRAVDEDGEVWVFRAHPWYAWTKARNHMHPVEVVEISKPQGWSL
jgi:hypothetical protein